MSTCNFSTLNAAGVYAMRPNGWDAMAWSVQRKAAGRMDRARFTSTDERDDAPRWSVRDAGTVVLEYKIPAYNLPNGCALKVTGQIVMRPGYYEGACLDWNLRPVLDAPRYRDSWNLNDWDGLGALAADVLESWDYCQEEDQGEGDREGAGEAITAALEDAAARMERICRHLCQIPLRCAAVASNGSALYIPMN